MAVALFDYGVWALRYPELAGSIDPTLAGAYFAEAGLYLNNTDCSPVADVTIRGVLLNMIAAHIAKLNATINGAAPSGLTGPISKASEGSVSVEVALPTLTAGSQGWFLQTTYGAAVWAALAPYRTASYVPGPRPYFGPYGYGFGQGWGGDRWLG